MSQAIKIAVVGATGLVGQNILEALVDFDLMIEEVVAVASERSAGNTVKYGDELLELQAIDAIDFASVDVALFAAGGSVSKEWAPQAAAAGCWVIDNSSVFRNDPDVPLVVPEVNPEALNDLGVAKIIANPNCSTIQMVVALKPLHDLFQLERIVVSTYQSVSGAGQKGIDELMVQTGHLMNARPVDQEDQLMARQIAFNVVPQIGDFDDNGFSGEEMKMVHETRKIFADEDIVVEPTAVRVPVFIGHAESIYIETSRAINIEQALASLSAAPGVNLMTKMEEYPTPFDNRDLGCEVQVGRVRQALGDDHGLHLWVVADNVGKGAAVNAVQILELLCQNGEL